MRYPLIVLAFVLTTAAAEAQETYSVNATAGQVTDLVSIAAAENEKVCYRYNLALTCTQAQACTAAGAAGGASCTAAQARAAQARIFPATQAGREEFVTFKMLAPVFIDQRASIGGWHRERLCIFWSSANQTQKDALCTGSGQSTNCNLCP